MGIVFPHKIEECLQKVLAHFWLNRKMEFTFPRIMDKYRRVLLILPRQQSALKLLQRWRERMLFALGNRNVVVLSIGAPLETAEQWSQNHIFFTDGDVNSVGLASVRVIDAVKKGRFKIAIDLSPDFDFTTAQVPLRAKIPTRIGIASETNLKIAERYFNILLRRNKQLNYENIATLISADKI